MSSRPLVILGIVIILAAAAGAIIHVAGRQGGVTGVESDLGGGDSSDIVSSSTSQDFYGSASTTASGTTTGAMGVPLPGTGSTTPDTSSWQIYMDNASGFSLEYPPNMLASASGGVLTLVLPKNAYFHWPLLDDAKITAYATTTCPAVISGALSPAPVQFTLDGMSFTQSVGSDVGAGQLYTEVAYDTDANGRCYRIDFFDHGTNGAGFYVGDASLIQKYDAQHAADMAAVYGVLNGIVGTFKVISH